MMTHGVIVRWAMWLLLGLLTLAALSAQAATTLKVDPITWNIIGLDSNNPSVGPNQFPVGARICNTGSSAASNLTASFVWDSVNPYINLRSGTNSSISVSSLAVGACTDVYFEVEVARNSSAYGATRNYHIAVTADAGASTGSTPIPRQLYVERLVSQGRNDVTTMALSTDGTTYNPVQNGGVMSLMVGNTYWIKLTTSTSTQGYNQIQSFINFPNAIFQILSVQTQYSADNSPYVSNPSSLLYGDACLWDSNPASATYRSCIGGDYKAGGDTVTTIYQVKILTVPGAPLINPEPLNSMVYDFSGSSFHYNSDFNAEVRYANIVNATLSKSFAPKTVNPGGASALTFTITNPGSAALSNLNFSDTLPAGVNVANSSTSVCNGGTLTTTDNGASSDTVALTGGSVPGLSSCTFSVSVTAATTATDGNYVNTSGHLFIGSNDTTSFATDTLVVSSKPPAPSTCTTPTTIATWTMPTSGQGSGGPPPAFTTKVADVSFATAASAGGITTTITTGGVTTNQWRITGGWQNLSGTPAPTATPYFEFSLDTSNYGGIAIQFAYDLEGNGNWANPGDNRIFIHSRADSGSFNSSAAITAAKGSWTTLTPYTAPASGLSTTTFRINTTGAKDAGASVGLDNITITGCPRPNPPTLSKSFSSSSIAQGGSSTLTFTVANPNSSALSGVGFSDTLPTGLVVANPNGLSNTCGGTVTAVAGTTSISLNNDATRSANTSCTISVNVTGNAAGAYTNTSGSVTATATGPNTTGGAQVGYGQASLTVVAPPVIAKTFGATTLITNGTPDQAVTSLAFTLTNPNTFPGAPDLTGVNFTDALPAGLVVATPNGLTTPACTSGALGGTITATAGSSSISLSSATLLTGASCSFSVNVKGTTTGTKLNSVTASSTNGGAGSEATATINVKTLTPGISILKQVSKDGTDWFSFVNVTPPASVYYRFTVENTGDVPLSSVSVSDPKVSTTGCAWSSLALYATATCTVGPITSLAGDHPNTATASGSSTAGAASASDSADYFGAQPGLSLLKEISTSADGPWSSSINVSPGSAIYYRFILTNIGNTNLTNPAVTDSDPALSALIASNCYFTNPLVANSSTVCVVPATASLTPNTTVTSTATGSATGTAQTPTSSAGYTTSGTTQLSLSKTHTGDFTAGQQGAIYTVTVGNTGTAATSGAITVVDTLPDGLTYVSGTGTGWTCGASGQTVTCTGSTSILGGGTSAITLTVNVAATASGTLTNSATASGGGAPNTPTAIDPTTIIQKPVLALTKTHAGNFIRGQNGVYTLTVGNTGPVATSGAITVVDTLPTGLTYVSGTGTDWTCGVSGQTVTCTSTAAIAAGASGNPTLGNPITLTVTVESSAPDSLTNTAAATGGGADNQANASDVTAIKPTYALLSDFRAYALSGVPVVEWRTSGEVGTLGFDLYRKDVNQPDESAFVQLNAEMLPALIDAPQGGAYYFVDTGAQIGQAYTYRLVEHEVDAKGEAKERNLGIHTVPIETQTPADANITLAELANDYARKARVPSTEEAARGKAAKNAKQEAKNHKRQKKSSDMVKLYVKDPGLYRIPVAQLATLLNMDAKEAKKQIGKYGYRLTSQGRDVAYHAADDNSALYFYNPGYKSVYTSTNVFWLGLGKKAGVPMAVVDGVPSTKPNQPKPPAPTGAETFQRTLEFEENHLSVLVFGLHGPEDDYWVWDYLFAGQPGLSIKTYTVTAPGIIAASSATLTLELMGGFNAPANLDHHLVIALNGNTVGETRWDGIAKQTLNLTLGPGSLKAGDNALTLTAVKDAGVSQSLFYVDRFTLKYSSQYQAANNRLTFNSIANNAIQISGFSAAPVVVSLNDPWNPVWVNVTGQAVAGGYGVTLNPASANTPYWAAAASAVPEVENAWTDAPSQLKDVPLDADYLVIATEEVKSAAQALADYRKTKGFSTAVVDLEDIMDEFNDGLFSPKAIRDFLTQAYSQWKTPPRFVVLAGAGSYDYQNYKGFNDSLIPPLLVQTPYEVAASDNRLGDVVGDDGLPEIIIGRIPAVNNAELQAYVDKVKAYESAAAAPWMQQVVLAADNAPDPAGDFPADSNDLAALVVRPYQTSKIYLGVAPYQTVSPARTGVLNALNQGAAYFNYLGHGNANQLANEKLLMQSDVTGLTNGGRLPVALFLTCAAADFSRPGFDSLGEALVLKPNGGAIAVWGPTGLSLNSEAKQFGDEFFNQTFRLGKRVLGESVSEAYQHYGANHYRFMLDIYGILGDPALRMK